MDYKENISINRPNTGYNMFPTITNPLKSQYLKSQCGYFLGRFSALDPDDVP